MTFWIILAVYAGGAALVAAKTYWIVGDNWDKVDRWVWVGLWFSLAVFWLPGGILAGLRMPGFEFPHRQKK